MPFQKQTRNQMDSDQPEWVEIRSWREWHDASMIHDSFRQEYVEWASQRAYEMTVENNNSRSNT